MRLVEHLRIARLMSCGALPLSLALMPHPAAAQPAQVQPGPVLPLSTAITLAREQNRALQAVRLDVTKAEQDAAALRTRLRPNFDVTVLSGALLGALDFEFKAGALGAFPATGPIPSIDTRISTSPQFHGVVLARITQPLSQLRRINFGAQALDIQQEVAREKVRTQELAVADGIKRLYYGIVQAEAGLTAQTEALAYYRELDRLMGEYVAQQVVLPSQQLEVRAGLARQEYQGLVLRQSITAYREQLNALLSRDLDEPFSVATPNMSIEAAADLGAAETQALAARPDVRIARLQTSQAQMDWRATRAAALPEISVSFNHIGFYNFEFLPRNAASIGILGRWEPWDWGRKRREAQAKRLTADPASMIGQEAERTVRLEVRSAFRGLIAARDLLHVADLARAPIRERLRVALDRFKLDASLQRDVLQAQTALADSEQQYQQALAGFWIARAEFERAIAEN